MSADTATKFEGLVRARRSPRKFLPEPIPAEQIRAILDDARHTPSNSNTQPWMVHIASGATLQRLSTELVAAYEQGLTSADFTSTYGDGEYLGRAQRFGAVYYGVQGIARADHEGRREVIRKNLRFHGAPHTAFLFMPRLGDGVRAAGDVGMYAQNFLLSLTARGYAGIPQAVLGEYADTVRTVLDVSSEFTLSFGISFGYADDTSPLRALNIERVPLARNTVLHDTRGVLDDE
ncbi:nitroreductase [Streptomyces sp. NPDC047973]|uniref:nitroreductase n=1 Tax=Streptomyces sp. NPDC047973 TaxID=3155383 RepID=UPI00344038B2